MQGEQFAACSRPTLVLIAFLAQRLVSLKRVTVSIIGDAGGSGLGWVQIASVDVT